MKLLGRIDFIAIIGVNLLLVYRTIDLFMAGDESFWFFLTWTLALSIATIGGLFCGLFRIMWEK